MATRKILLQDGTNALLLEDGTDFLVKDGVAQASDDVLIRLGPKISDTAHSGLVAPQFTASGGGASAVFGGMYYQMMQQWFEAA